jgi:hemolysin D
MYEGRVTLEQDQYKVGETGYPLRYGMAALAEIVVRERRLIDLV